MEKLLLTLLGLQTALGMGWVKLRLIMSALSGSLHKLLTYRKKIIPQLLHMKSQLSFAWYFKMWGSTDNLVCAFQALVWAYSEGESGASALATSAAGGELFPGVPVQHTGLAAGRGQNAAQARRWRRHRPLLPAAGCQSILLLIQVRTIFFLSLPFI